MKRIVVAVAFTVSSITVFAQGIAPLTGSAVFLTESARKVSPDGGDKHTWSDFTPSEMKWSRTVAGLESVSGTTGGVLIDSKTYLHFPVAPGVSELSETFDQSTTREGQSLVPGSTWKAERTYAGTPATWCHDLKSNIDSKFEVNPPEPYTLTIDGKEATLQVTPVVERGWWNRCYSGRRYTRFLVSRDLGAVVSIEHIGFNPQGHVHDSSYRFNVKEIKRN